MSAASISHFNLRSLLQTRSLCDLQAPPPTPKSSAREKSRRRLLQVNGPFVVPEACPPISGIREPSRLELVQTPDTPGESPTSSVQVSPFIAAARPDFDTISSRPISRHTQSRTHQQTQSDAEALQGSQRSVAERAKALPNKEPAHGLRDPPVDRRKAWRYCSDFGLGRNEFNSLAVGQPSPSPPVADNSSLASTPLAMFTESETDSDTSSVDHPLGFSFPQPPSIDQSLHLRRMSSSPMFSSEETEAVKEFLRKRWGGVQASNARESPRGGDHWNGAGDFTSNSGLTSDHDHELDLKRPTIHRIAIQSSPGALFGRELTPSILSTAGGQDAPISESAALPPTSRRTGTSWKRSTTAATPRDGGFQLARSRTRSTSSSHKVANPLPRSASRTSVTSPSQTSLRLQLELSERLDRLDLSIEKLKAHEPQSRRGAALVLWEHQMHLKSQPPLPLSPPSLASAGRQKPVHRSHVSVPQAGLGLANIKDRSYDSPKTLGAAFNHRSTRSQPAVRVTAQHHEKPTPKSFIDITPEQEIRRKTSRMRVRKLLARASIGVFGWGRSLAGKKSTSK